jgi:hypothetical protein
VGHFVLETLGAWQAEGLQQALLRAVPIGPPPASDAPLPDDLDEDLITYSSPSRYGDKPVRFHFDAYKLPGTICMPACCRPWGAVEPACPPGPGRPLTGAQLQLGCGGDADVVIPVRQVGARWRGRAVASPRIRGPEARSAIAGCGPEGQGPGLLPFATTCWH